MTIPSSLIEPAAHALATKFRAVTERLVGLPAGETVEIEAVTGVRWRGYARYQGGLRTQISFNVERPFTATELAHVTAHETYSGHHTHRAWQEDVLVSGRGETERTLDVLRSPDAVVSEGIAEVGAELVMAEDGHELAARCLRDRGLTFDATTESKVAEALRLLKPVNSNAALFIHHHREDLAAAEDYLRKWSLMSSAEATHSAQKLSMPVPVGYVHLYAHGAELCRPHVRNDGRRLRTLMTARVVPTDLM